MAFQQLLKWSRTGKRIRPREISITKNSIAFGSDVIEHFGGDYVMVLVDREKLQVAFVGTKDKSEGFKLQDKHKQSKWNSNAIHTQMARH
ncbi:hypothetical protein LCGC14_3049360, partial [marine sediment metagenome]